MSSRMIDLFFELLRISVAPGKEGISIPLSCIPTQKEWNDLYAFAHKQSILGVVFSGVERLPKEQLPEKRLLIEWFAKTGYLATQNKLLDRRTREVTELFAKAGMSSCVLKGQGVARLYPNPRRRSCGDIDLWVDAPRREVLRFVREHCKVGDVLMYHVDAKVFDDAAVEVHYVPAVSFNPWRYWRYKRYFSVEAKVQMQLMDGSLGFAHPSIAFHGVYSMIHVFNHALSNEVKLKQIVDYYYILLRMTEQDRKSVLYTLTEMGLKRFSGAMMWVMGECMGMEFERMLCKPDMKAGRQLLADILTGDDVASATRNMKRLRAFCMKMRKLAKYIPLYPSEVLWAPIWKLWHLCWMKRNN